MSAMFDPVVSGVKAFGSAVASVPDSVYDGVSKVGSAVLRVNDNAFVAYCVFRHPAQDQWKLRTRLV